MKGTCGRLSQILSVTDKKGRLPVCYDLLANTLVLGSVRGWSPRTLQRPGGDHLETDSNETDELAGHAPLSRVSRSNTHRGAPLDVPREERRGALLGSHEMRAILSGHDQRARGCPALRATRWRSAYSAISHATVGQCTAQALCGPPSSEVGVGSTAQNNTICGGLWTFAGGTHRRDGYSSRLRRRAGSRPGAASANYTDVRCRCSEHLRLSGCVAQTKGKGHLASFACGR